MSLDRSLLGNSKQILKIRSMFQGEFYKFPQNAEKIPFFSRLQQKRLPFPIVFVCKVILFYHS